MKHIEYYYNILYYFFYKGFIKIAIAIRKYNPFIIFIFLFYKIPFIKHYFQKKGINDPFKWHMGSGKIKWLEDKTLSLGTIYGHGLAASVLAGFYFGIYHIFINILFPEFEDKFLYTLIIFFSLAYGTDILLTQTSNQSEQYINKFNKITGWWRIKWSIITALSPFFALWFSLSTTTGGDIGRFILELKGYSEEQINRLAYLKITEQNFDEDNYMEDSEQEILNRIKQHSPPEQEKQ